MQQLAPPHWLCTCHKPSQLDLASPSTMVVLYAIRSPHLSSRTRSRPECCHHHGGGPRCSTKASARHAEQQEVIHGDEPAHLEVSLGTQAGRTDASATVTACIMPPEGRRGRPRCPAWLHSGWSLAKELPRQLSTVRNESRSLSGRPNFERPFVTLFTYVSYSKFKNTQCPVCRPNLERTFVTPPRPASDPHQSH